MQPARAIPIASPTQARLKDHPMVRDSVFQRFLRQFEITGNRPASEAEFTRTEAKLGCALPASVKTCYRICDGGRANDDQSDLHLFSLKQALDYRQTPGFLDSMFGNFPFAENNDSNPICICCKPPLAGFVVQVFHDDVPQLKFRSLDGFFSECN
jgi:cell wall assembly regulator SMI1